MEGEGFCAVVVEEGAPSLDGNLSWRNMGEDSLYRVANEEVTQTNASKEISVIFLIGSHTSSPELLAHPVLKWARAGKVG